MKKEQWACSDLEGWFWWDEYIVQRGEWWRACTPALVGGGLGVASSLALSVLWWAPSFGTLFHMWALGTFIVLVGTNLWFVDKNLEIRRYYWDKRWFPGKLEWLRRQGIHAGEGEAMDKTLEQRLAELEQVVMLLQAKQVR